MNKSFALWSALVAAAALVAGCQETTSTGPSTTDVRTGKPVVKKLTVMAAETQDIARGDTDKVLITIDRDNFNDPVTIRLNDLPRGVEVVGGQAVIPADSNTTTLELRASNDAEVGEHHVQIDATAPGLDENLQTFKLTVTDKS